MIRLRTLLRNLNLRYVLGEVLLIFVGINLAIWFNNWNTSKQLRRDKVIVLDRIEEELQSNREELVTANQINSRVMEGIQEYEKIFEENTDIAVATPRQMADLQSRFPGAFQIQDSVQIDENTFQYMGGTYLNLQLPELRAIAWKTAQSLEILNELDYDCLFDLENLYNLQQQVAAGYEKVTEALSSESSIGQVIRRLGIAGQLEEQLVEDYRSMLERMEGCR